MAEVASHSSTFVRGVVQLFAAQGLETDSLLRDAQVDAERLKHAHDRIPLPDYDRLWTLAVERSGLLREFPELSPDALKMGVFGSLRKPEDPLEPGDRVELYRPLIADPKQARRQRAKNKNR